MADSTIEWTGKTWNPTTGCTKVSKECDNCYAETETYRYMHNPKLPKYSKGFDVFVQHEDTLSTPFKWKKPQVVFVNSMSDLFHKDVTLDFLQKVFKVMNDTPQHTYQILTKRHNILKEYSSKLNWTDNIWMGVSVGHKAGERRIKPLVECDAKYKFLSVEPLIEELSDLDLKGIDWVIAGGESGPGARPMNKEWVLKVKKNCEDQGVPFFFKQWGEDKFNPDQSDPTINKHHRYHSKGGCLLDGSLYWTNPTIKDDLVPKITVYGEEHLLMDDYEGLNTIWELKSYLPFMDKEIYRQLKKDIKKNGLTDPILYIKTDSGKKLVIEGHTRLRACIKSKKKNIPTKEIKDKFKNIDEIKLWMVKHQNQRRNLSTLEKIKLAILSKPTLEKLAEENLSKAGKGKEIDSTVDTNDEIAKLAGVGRTTITRYLSVQENANKSVLKELESEKISINKAYNLTESKRKKGKPAKIKPIKKEIKLKIYGSIDEATASLKSNTVEGIIIINSEEQIEKLTSYQKNKYGIVYIKNET